MPVRPARVSDAHALAALVDGHPLFERYGVRSADLAASLARAIEHGERVCVDDDTAGPRGFAWWTPTGTFARSPYLRLLVVAANATGEGVGARLMDAVEQGAFAVANDLFALANADNEGARRFYTRRGYVEVGRLEDYVAPGLHEVVLRKRTPTAS
ncbi:MAG: N-acetyltransferase family protein [Trueperaceae bacterium]